MDGSRGKMLHKPQLKMEVTKVIFGLQIKKSRLKRVASYFSLFCSMRKFQRGEKNVQFCSVII